MTLTGEIPPNVTGYRAVDLLWTLADSRRAQREGWDLVETKRGLQIRPLPDNRILRLSQLGALTHCGSYADISTLHARALAIHFYSLAERK